MFGLGKVAHAAFTKAMSLPNEWGILSMVQQSAWQKAAEAAIQFESEVLTKFDLNVEGS